MINTDTQCRPMSRRIRQEPDAQMQRRREWRDARREGMVRGQ